MSKSTFKGSLLATTVIAGMALATPAFAQSQTVPETAPPAPVTPTDTQGNTPPAAPSDQTPAAGVQTSETAAPAEPTSAQEIVITGTLIRNPNLVASAPVSVVGQDEIRLRQNNTAAETLTALPGATAASNAQVNNGQVGASFVNLRSLGTARNIVLLDGVRIVPFDQLLRTDLNNIPLALIDRVDVLTGGASSTYGADAVAGVVNFITRNDFSGMELSVGDRITQRGDGNYLRGDLTIGANFDDGRGNAVISVGYQESDPVFQGGDRPWSNLAIDSSSPGFLAAAGSSRTVPTAFDIGGGISRRQVSPDGTGIVPFYAPFNFNPYNVFQTPFQRYNLYSAGHYDITDHLTVYARGLFSHNSVKSIIAPSGIFDTTLDIPLNNPFLTAAQRNFFCATQDFDPATAGRQTLTAGGLNTAGQPVNPPSAACLAGANPTLQPGDAGFQQFSVGVRRRAIEGGPRISDYQTRTWDFRAGLRGDITDKIGFDVFGSRGITNSVQNIAGYWLTSRVQQALLANGDGCFDTSNACTPLDIFGVAGSVTPDMINFIQGNSSITTNVKLSQARGTINGDTPLQLWAKNPVSFAIGTEYRKYSSDILPDALALNGDIAGGGFGGAPPIVNGGLDVYEGFAEVIAPIISDRPFFEELQLEAGIRRSHYTLDADPLLLTQQGLSSNPKFNTTTWKVAGSWAPVRDIKFRGAYNHAVRAPNISELFTPITTVLTNLAVDPCAGTTNAALASGDLPLNPNLNDPNLRAVCIAQGSPAAQIGFITNPTGGQANLTTGGSLRLTPEIANTWTVGAVLRPRFLPGFNASIDYYHIKIKHAITIPTPDDLIGACFNNITAASATDPACTIIRRSTSAGGLEGNPLEVGGLFGISSNQGKLSTDGVDLSIDYRRPLGMILNAPAKLAINFAGNWTHSQKFKAIANSDTSVDRECVGRYSANCGFPNGSLLPRYSFNERTTLSLGRVDLSLLWRYISKFKYEPGLAPLFSGTIESVDSAGNPCTPTSTFALCNAPGTFNGETVDFNHIKAQHYFDFATRFNVNEHFDLTFTINNLFDKKPPIVGNTAGSTSANSGNTFPALYDPLGRRFAAAARIKF
jgi:iron complex outermembrane recepter protein